MHELRQPPESPRFQKPGLLKTKQSIARVHSANAWKGIERGLDSNYTEGLNGASEDKKKKSTGGRPSQKTWLERKPSVDQNKEERKKALMEDMRQEADRKLAPSGDGREKIKLKKEAQKTIEEDDQIVPPKAIFHEGPVKKRGNGTRPHNAHADVC